MAKQLATIVRCTDRMTAYEHMMRDNCTTCAPYWDIVAICPTHRRKLNAQTGYCKDCRKYLDMTPYEEALTTA